MWSRLSLGIAVKKSRSRARRGLPNLHMISGAAVRIKDPGDGQIPVVVIEDFGDQKQTAVLAFYPDRIELRRPHKEPVCLVKRPAEDRGGRGEKET